MTTIRHQPLKTHVTPLTGRELQCPGCGHWYVEIRNFHFVREENDHIFGTCPMCGMVNDLAALKGTNPRKE
jgi:transcription elongation factor Elf1